MESANLERDSGLITGNVTGTVELAHVRAATKRVEQYVSRYSATPDQKGLPVLLRGDHGSGKTHTLAFLSHKVSTGEIVSSAGIDEPYQIYAKADSPDIVELFRQLMSHMDMSLLSDTADKFLRFSAAEQYKAISHDESSDDESTSIANETAEDIRNHPEKVEELFNSYLIEEGAVRDRQAREMEKVPRRQEFQSAFHYFTTNEGLKETAFAWLCGQDVGKKEGRKIGIKGPIDSPEIATYAMGLLARLFKHIHRPIIFYIDQYEKLILDAKGPLLKDNLGALRKLLEWLIDERAMLIMAGLPAAWDALADDIKERFGLNIIELPILSPKEACQIIALYLDSVDSESNRLAHLDIAPFTDDSVHEILRYGGANIRRLLQICSAVFDDVMYGKQEPSIIDSEHVRRTLKDRKLGYYDRDMVVFDVDRLLAEHAANFVRNQPVGNTTADFAVLDLSGQPRLLIDIDQAVFYDDEAGTAVKSLDMIAQARQAGISALIVRIVLGYVSPQITSLMEKVVHELIVYDPSKFQSRFSRYLDQHLTKISPMYVPGSASDQALQMIQSDVSVVAESRKQDAQSLEEKLEALLNRQHDERQVRLRERSVTEWLEKRENIIREIRAAREERARVEMEELKGLHDAANRDRLRRTLLMTAMTLALAIIVPLFGFLYTAENVSQERVTTKNYLSSMEIELSQSQISVIRKGALLFAVSCVLLLPIILLFRLNLLEPKALRELRMPITSVEALDRLAHALKGHKVSLRKAINDPDPHVRYAGALDIKPRSSGHAESLLRSETSSIIRRVLANCIGAIIPRDDMMLMASRIDEGPYLIEAFLQKRQLPIKDLDVAKLLDWQQVFFTLHGVDIGDTSSNLVTITEAARRGQAYSSLAEALAKSFSNGLRVESSPISLSQIDELRLRSTLHVLSPLESGSLGTYDHLQIIRLVDEYYIFFRQLTFMRERGLL